MLRLAAIGDVHGRWVDADRAWFAGADYDAILVVGDLAGLRFGPTLEIARQLARLDGPVVVVAGNHDGPNPAQLLAEVAGRPWAGDVFTRQLAARYAQLESVLAGRLGGYSAHEVGPAGDRVTVIVGRPMSMGGPQLSFPGFLRERFGVEDLEGSAARLREVVDGVQTERVVFVAHNGPAGLGSRRADPWGCDFRAAEGDWGDADLTAAVAYAQACGKRVLAVLAGHMHRKLRGGGDRTASVERDGVVYINTAQVPRIDASGRHHVALEIDGLDVRFSDVRVPA
ncbi:MAG: metallophosphoesterase family protein [Myxococcota bacterium]